MSPGMCRRPWPTSRRASRLSAQPVSGSRPAAGTRTAPRHSRRQHRTGGRPGTAAMLRQRRHRGRIYGAAIAAAGRRSRPAATGPARHRRHRPHLRSRHRRRWPPIAPSRHRPRPTPPTPPAFTEPPTSGIGNIGQSPTSATGNIGNANLGQRNANFRHREYRAIANLGNRQHRQCKPRAAERQLPASAQAHPDRLEARTRAIARLGSFFSDRRMAALRAAEVVLSSRIQSIFDDVDVVVTPGAATGPSASVDHGQRARRSRRGVSDPPARCRPVYLPRRRRWCSRCARQAASSGCTP